MMNGYSKNDNNFARQWFKKMYAIRHLGSKCLICKNENIFQLEFHHRESKEKEENLCWLCMHDCKLDKIIYETNKCDLLCGNCHMDMHYPFKETFGHFRKIDILEKFEKNKCEECGYNKNISCLVFHHINKEDKEFNIGHKLGAKNDTSAQEILDEINKCKLLCVNCHRLCHVDIDRFNRLKEYIDHKFITHKEYKKVNESLVLDLLKTGFNQREISRKIGCTHETINIIVKKMRLKGIYEH